MIGYCEYYTDPKTSALADHLNVPAAAWTHVNGIHMLACQDHTDANCHDEICTCAVPGHWDREFDVQFGDRELTNNSGWVPLSPEEQGPCEHYTTLDAYLLPSGKEITFWSNRYNYDFEIVGFEGSYENCTPVPGKLVRIKGKAFGGCGRWAKYSDGHAVKCGPCCGQESLPPGTTMLTIEGLEASVGSNEKTWLEGGESFCPQGVSSDFDSPEEIATLDEIPKPTICPGCGVKLAEDCCSVVDGTYHFGEGGCADQAGEPGMEFFPIEFELRGARGTRQGVCQGTDPQDAIKNFLADYPTSGDCGTIVAIRVPGVAN